jgi:hypothetical protein
MSLSEMMQRLLSDWCSAPPSSPGELKTLSFEIGGEWWCPLDGKHMQRADSGYPVCPECGRSLGMNVIHPLVELQRHRR